MGRRPRKKSIGRERGTLEKERGNGIRVARKQKGDSLEGVRESPRETQKMQPEKDRKKTKM